MQSPAVENFNIQSGARRGTLVALKPANNTSIRRILKRGAHIILALVLSMLLATGTVPLKPAYAQVHSTQDILDSIEGALEWSRVRFGLEPGQDMLASEAFLQYAGASPNDWYAFSLARLGYPADFETYLTALEENVTTRYATDAKLDRINATEWHRIGLAVAASGGDPTVFGVDSESNSIDLVADGTYNRAATNSLSAQGMNGYIFALIMLDSLPYSVPEDALDNRESMIVGILKLHMEGSGFSLSASGEASTVITAMALQGLAVYAHDDTVHTYTSAITDVEMTRSVPDVLEEALTFLSEQQNETGAFSDAETTAQVLLALTSVGIDINTDERFIKNGFTVLDGLLCFQNVDGGFTHALAEDGGTGESEVMATDQALRGLIAAALQSEGMNRFYNLSGGESQTLFSLMDSSTGSSFVVGDTNVGPSNTENSGPQAGQAVTTSDSQVSDDGPLPIIALILVIVAVILVALTLAVVMPTRKKKSESPS